MLRDLSLAHTSRLADLNPETPHHDQLRPSAPHGQGEAAEGAEGMSDDGSGTGLTVAITPVDAPPTFTSSMPVVSL